MHNYEFILIDSSKRSNGSACDFSYELNRPIRDIKKLELVYSSLSNTILTFTNNDIFYFQEEGNPFIPGVNNKLYIEESKINITEHKIYYDEQNINLLSNDKIFKWSEKETDGTRINYSFIITKVEFDYEMYEFYELLKSKIHQQGSQNNYSIIYDADKLTISGDTYEFSLDFTDDDDLHLRMGFEKYEYDYSKSITSTKPFVESPKSVVIISRQLNFPNGNYTFSSFIDKLQNLFNNVEGSSFEYIFSLFNGCISIEVVQDESDHKKTFHLKTFGEIDYWGFRIYDFSNNYDVKHVAVDKLKGSVKIITLIQNSYYLDALQLEIQNSLTSDYKIEILDGTTMSITNNIIKFKINNEVDSLRFIFNNNEYSNIQISNQYYAFQNSVIAIHFENGSYTSDEILEFLKIRLNAFERSGYDVYISLSTFKITISNALKKFMILFSIDNSVWKKFGFKQENTKYLNQHTSDFTCSLESSDYILVRIKNIPTPITNKQTSGSFFIPIISSRYEVQTISENQSFNQSITVNNLDLSDVHIKLLNDEGDIIKSEELNLKMLIKCYK